MPGKAFFGAVRLLFILWMSVLTLHGNPTESGATAYRVYFSDKGNETYHPELFLGKECLQRHLKAGLRADDFSYRPLNAHYINSVTALADSVTCESRWFNFITVWSSRDDFAKTLSGFEFVEKVIPLHAVVSAGSLCTTAKAGYDTLPPDTLLLRMQLEHLQGQFFKEKAIDGSGIKIAVFDVGFPDFDHHPAFRDIRNNNRISATYDFIRRKKNVYYGHPHGTMTTACIGGKAGDSPLGLATGATYMLARTEINLREPFREEECWLMAAEWADINGADIISSSLGYGHHRYYYADLDGETSLVARAAGMATRKGILVVNSAGNEYLDKWRFLVTPADNDSVLTVGGIDHEKGYHISFSSVGPNAKLNIKPNVSALGHVITAQKKRFTEADGTSFSCPLISGFAACVLQAKPEFKGRPVELLHYLESVSTLYPYFDYAHGFGVPQASRVFSAATTPEPTFTFEQTPEKFIIRLKPEVMKIPLPFLSWSDVVYYHIENEAGVAQEYAVVLAAEPEVLALRREYYHSGQKLVVHYRGYTQTYSF